MLAATKEEPESDSSDEEEPGDTKALALKDAQKTTIASSKKPVILNVIYIGHLPPHCEEQELTAFLKQFGRLAALRVCRSPRTGGSKGYAFARFESPEVAAIVAETLNGHLLFEKRLVSHVLAPEQIHKKLFSSDARQVALAKKKAKSTPAEPKSMKKLEEISARLVEKEKEKREKLKKLGIYYDFPGYEASVNKINNKQEEEKEASSKKRGKEQTENEEKSLSQDKNNKKRKGSFDGNIKGDDGDSSTPKDKKKTETKPQSEKKQKKKDKKNRRKSAP